VERHDLRAHLWARAHHEAAHAVVGTLLGGHVTEIAIWSGPPVAGRARLTGLDDSPDGLADHGLVRRIVHLLAGPIAEQIATGGRGLIQNEPASLVATALTEALCDPATIDPDSDLGKVATLIADHFGPDGEVAAAAAVDHLAMNVETLVRERWSAVEVVVASLLRHGHLTEEQFQSLLTLTMPAPPPSDLLQALPEAL
jgi:hypothetical protein